MYTPPEDIEYDDEGYPIPKGVTRKHSSESASTTKTNFDPILSTTTVHNKTYKGRAEVMSLTCKIIKITDKALLIKFQQEEDNPRSEWFPISQVKSYIQNSLACEPNNYTDVVVISHWIAKNKNIEI